MRVLTKIIIILLLSITKITAADWFLLPGFYYLPDTGINILLIGVLQHNDSRLLLDLEYANRDEQLYNFKYLYETEKWKINTQSYFEKNYLELFLVENGLPDKYGEYVRKRFNLTASIGKKYLDKIIGLNIAFDKYNSDNYTNVYEKDLNGSTMNAGLYFGIERIDSLYNTMAGIKWYSEVGMIIVGRRIFPKIGSDVRLYLPVINDGLSLCFQFGAFNIFSDNLPLYAQFHIGGSKSLRGYLREIMSGSKYILARMETRTMLVKKQPFPFLNTTFFDLQFVYFIDSGECWNHSFADKEYLFTTGAGLHLIITPDFMIRFDFASPVSYANLNFYMDIEQSF